MKTIICDLDGTIADLSNRLPFIQDENGKKLDNPDWESFYMACGDDKPIKAIIDLVEEVSVNYKIVFVTGRNTICAGRTINWLYRIFGEDFKFGLLMRYQEDYRPDTEVKPDLLKDYLKDFPETEIAFILEDRNSMVKKWRELGYICLQVAEGNF